MAKGKKKPAGNSGGVKQNKPAAAGLQGWWRRKSPVFRFLMGFIAFMIAFYIVYASDYYEQYLEMPILRFQSGLSSFLLNLVGQETVAVNDIIRNSAFSVSIKGGCDGMEATALFVAAIVSFPVSWNSKFYGLAAGITTLLFLNILRIAGLFLAGIYWPKSFDLLHEQGGFILFTLVSITLWLVWFYWAEKKENTKHAEA